MRFPTLLSLPFSQVAELICTFAAFLYLRNEKSGLWRSFRWFMLFTVALETLGFIFVLNKTANHWLYNIYLPIEMFFKYYLLYRLCRDYFKVSYWIIPFLLLLSVLYVIESIDNNFNKYSVESNSVGSLGIMVICVLYFYYFLKKDEYVNIYDHPPFWIVTGLFFFYIGSTACSLFFNYLSNIYLKQHIPVRFIIFAILNFILYGCWTYAFLCRYRNNISYS